MQPSKTVVLITPVCLLLLFGSTLIGVDRLAFRDVSFFYTPLYDYVAQRTATDWIPLWNPLDQTGIPLLGETTTAVLYPIRYLLFSLPLSTETAISWYVLLHLVLASITARTAARWNGISPSAADFAGLAYPMSGSLLFLYTNPPFLVAAAWLPLVIGGLLSKNQKLTDRRTIIAGIALAMMILGGDPQTGLHAMIVVGAVWLARLIRRRVQPRTIAPLLFAPLLASVLAAPQLAASISWSRQSERAVSDTESLFDPPVVGQRKHETFQFSLPPWHAIELLTPHAFGDLLPQHRRLSQLIPGDGRMWTPSIYMGVGAAAALLLTFVGLRRECNVWTAIMLVTFALACGHFGLCWLLQATTHSLLDTDSAAGGAYWWLYQCLPGYDSFRYPAKWLPVFSFSVAMIIGHRLDRKDWMIQWQRVLPILLVILSLGLLFVSVLKLDPTWIASPDSLPRDEFWGPLDVDAGLRQVQYSLCHSLIVVAAIGALLRIGTLRQWTKPSILTVLLLLLACELTVSGYGMIARVNRHAETELLQSFAMPKAGSKRMRTQAGEGWPANWREQASDTRLLEVEASTRAAQFGRRHLDDRVSMLNNMVSIQSESMRQFWTANRQLAQGMSAAQQRQHWKTLRDWLMIDSVISTNGQPKSHDPFSLVNVNRQLTEPFLHARIFTQWKCQPDVSIHERLTAMSGGDRTPVVAASSDLSSAKIDSSEACVQIINSKPEYVHLQVASAEGCLVTRPELQDGHWTAEYAVQGSRAWKTATVYRVDVL
ncbi:MAG: hypothetical protein AB8B91_05935, partial [Rubripirellula sp.]